MVMKFIKRYKKTKAVDIMISTSQGKELLKLTKGFVKSKGLTKYEYFLVMEIYGLALARTIDEMEDY